MTQPLTSFLLSKKNMEKKSSILLIDRLSRMPGLTRFRSIAVGGADAGMSLDMILEISDFQKYRLQNSCNNLLCFVKYGNHGDPACLIDLPAKKLITLPVPHKHPSSETVTFYYGLGFDKQTNMHKTLRIDVGENIHSNPLSNYVINARVITLGGDTWEPVKSSLPAGSIFGKPLVVEDGSMLAWADFPQTAASNSSAVTVFNVAEEKFSTVTLPQHIEVGHLATINNRLCVVDLSSNRTIQIWMLEDIRGDSWSRLCMINMKATNGLKDHGRTRVLGELGNGELLLKSYGSYFVYECETERLEYVHLPVADPESEVHCYAGSFATAHEIIY